MEFETIIGLEIHVQLKTKSKMFCRCNNYAVDAEPNTTVCEVCFAMPGSLPVTNKQAVMYSIKTGLALNCAINEKTKFDRKHYFYPDLPKGYQISQYDQPIAINGYLDIEIPEGDKFYSRKVKITRAHMEEDAGKLIHPEGSDYSLVDLNRAGTPLLEIVTEPDIRSPKEARIFAENLRLILRYINVSDANMEQGNMRVDANISLRLKGAKKFGEKVEIKNMNSFKMIEKALIFEVERQKKALENNEKIIQETRGWDDTKGVTISQRTKEEAHDYKYFPEPDVPPIVYKDMDIDLERIKKEMPELPTEKIKRLIEKFNLSPVDANTLVSDKNLALFYENTLSKLHEKGIEIKTAAKKSANWILTELLGKLNEAKLSINESEINEEKIAELLNLIEKGQITGKIAKDIFEEMFKNGKTAKQIINEKDIKMVEVGEIDKIIDKVLLGNPKSVEDFKSGKGQAIGFLVGQVMQATKGQADPKTVNEILRNKLK